MDHVSLAAESTIPLLDRYRGDLGGVWIDDAIAPGMHWLQVRYANGMKVEMLEPARVDAFPFLRRYLDQLGAGPHHYTFKVADLTAMIEALETNGYTVTGVNRDDPNWQEGFVRPKEALGIVVQVAAGPDETEHVPPAGTVEPRCERPAQLARIVHLVRSIAEARRLFVGVLGGQVIDRSAGWLELAWPGPGRIGFMEPEPGSRWDAWLGARPGRLGWLDFSLVDPDPIGDVEHDKLGQAWIPAEHNHGVWLRLR